jgi:hypothetical protein
MFRRMFERRMKMMPFTVGRNSTIYFARAIWLTMEFSSINFATHVFIRSLFVRFLAQQTGFNVATGVGNQIKDLRNDLSKLETKNKRSIKHLDGRCDSLHTQINNKRDK